MKIHLLSDLHLESHPYTLVPHPDADVIVLAGDVTTQRSYGRFKALLRDTRGKPTLYIPGNHEYYNNSFSMFDAEIATYLDGYPNVQRLDAREHIDLCGFRFVGATLWSDFGLPFAWQGHTRSDPETAKRLARDGISDFARIARFTPEHAEGLHIKARIHLSRYVGADKPPTVFVTHFLPSPRSIDKQFATSPLNPYFASNCEDLMGSSVKLWLHGHSHASCDYVVGSTRVVCNPRGYTSAENPAFNAKLLVEV